MDEIITLVSLQLGIRSVNAGDRIVEDLGAESADVANIIAAVEDRFHITIDEAEIADIRTVADLYELIQNRI
jgi:acyl carrier protein